MRSLKNEVDGALEGARSERSLTKEEKWEQYTNHDVNVTQEENPPATRIGRQVLPRDPRTSKDQSTAPRKKGTALTEQS